MGVINHISSILKFSLKTVVYPLCFLISNRIRLDHCYWACHHNKVEMQNFQSPILFLIISAEWDIALELEVTKTFLQFFKQNNWPLTSALFLNPGRGRGLLMLSVVIKPIVLHFSVLASAGLSYASDHTMQDGKKKKKCWQLFPVRLWSHVKAGLRLTSETSEKIPE